MFFEVPIFTDVDLFMILQKPIHDETAEVAPPLNESLENGFNISDLDGLCGFQVSF